MPPRPPAPPHPAPPAPPGDDVDAFTTALEAFTRAARRARSRHAQDVGEDGLTMAQFHLLDPLLTAARPLPVGVLAESAGVASPTATRMLDGLQERGLVQRVRPEHDRRVVHIALTERGVELATAQRAELRHRRERLFDRLPPADRRGAARLLERLAAAIEEDA